MNVLLKLSAVAVVGALLASCTPHQQNAAGGALVGGAIGAIASGGDPAVALGAAALGGVIGGASTPSYHSNRYYTCLNHGYSHHYCHHYYGY